METILFALDFLQQIGVSPFEGILLILIGAIVYILALINSQNKKNGYLKTEEFHKFEKKYIEKNKEYLTKEDFNEFKEAHDNVHKDIGDRLVKVETILEKVVESLKELKEDVKELMKKGK